MADGGNLEITEEQSKDLALKLEESLKNKIYDEVLPPLVNGIKNSKYPRMINCQKENLKRFIRYHF